MLLQSMGLNVVSGDGVPEDKEKGGQQFTNFSEGYHAQRNQKNDSNLSKLIVKRYSEETSRAQDLSL